MDPDKVLAVVAYLARLRVEKRPFGIMFEDQNGSWLPCIMQDATHEVRRCMEENNWGDGQLLIHVHKGYGISDASQLAAIGAGATGIWCGVSANGAMTGHASSLLTLTNLARLGNRFVRERYNFLALRKAAVTIHEVCTREEPPYLTEVYGRGALDLIWGGGLMANQWADQQTWSEKTDEPFELQRLLGIAPKVRISTMAGPAMFLAKLTEFFGSVVEGDLPSGEDTKSKDDDLDTRWPRMSDGHGHIGHVMHSLLHADLRNQQRLNYNHESGLYELYRRAYAESVMEKHMSPEEKERTRGFCAQMQVLVERADPDLDTHALILELKERFCNEETCREEWTFEAFYPEFLESHTHDRGIAERLFRVLDSDGSGSINYTELVSASKWVIREFDRPHEGRHLYLDSLHSLMSKLVTEWLVPEALIYQMCSVEGATGELRRVKSEPTNPSLAGPGEVQVLTGMSARDFVLQA